jgi:Spy/CpxP family protein refolding chaperone
MDFLSSKRLITTTLVVLVLLNIVLMGVIWWQNFVSSTTQTVEVTRVYTGNGHRGTELDLTDQQRDAFRKLRREHFRKSMPAVQKIIELKKQMISEAIKVNPDNAKLSAIADSLGKRQSWLEKDLALHFNELAKLCTPAQRDSLEKLLNNIYTVRYQKMSSWRGRSNSDHPVHDHRAPMPLHPSEP